jgi:DNA polymerase-4
MADRVASRLREHAKVARTVQLKLRYRDFATITRAHTLSEPTDLAATIGAAVRELLDGVDLRDGIRLLGVTALQIDDATAVQGQLPMGAGAEVARDDALERTIDAVRARFGTDAVGRAAHAVGGRVRTDRRGSLWGPDDEPVDPPASEPPVRAPTGGE